MNYYTYIFVIILLGFSLAANACICDEVNLQDTKWEILDEIFIGKVINIERKEIKHYPAFDEPYTTIGWETTFGVIKKWKGSDKSHVKITHSGSSCSELFEFGYWNYFITAQKTKFTNNTKEDTKNTSYLTTDGCYITISEVDQDSLYKSAIRILDKQYPSSINMKSSSHNELPNRILSFNNILILLMALTIGILYFKRK